MVVSFVGAGNVATHLALALSAAGHRIASVWSRTEASARELADKVGATPTTDLQQLATDADAIIFSVKDSALEALASKVETDALCIHTAGSMPLSALPQERRAVLYPMQTFSKHTALDYSKIPIYLEVEHEADKQTLGILASAFSTNVTYVTSAQRAALHLAAVFACNFANRCYDMAAEILEANDLGFESMLPLVDETARKVHYAKPREAQTGPAVRWDENVMAKHLALLSGDLKETYELMSKSIHDRHRND